MPNNQGAIAGINTNYAAAGIALQMSGDALTPEDTPAFVHGLIGGTALNMSRTIENVPVACTVRGDIDARVDQMEFNPTIEAYGYQEPAPLFCYGALGEIESTELEPGLYQHVCTLGPVLPYFTVWGQTGLPEQLGIGRTWGCKISELAIGFTGTEPLHINPTFMGCDLERLEGDPFKGIPPLCYGGYFVPVEAEFKLDTGGRKLKDATVTEATVTITNNLEAIRSGSAKPCRINELSNTAAVSLGVTPEDYKLWWRMVSGAEDGTRPLEKIVYGSYRLKFKHRDNPDWTITIESSKVVFTCELPAATTEGATGTFTFSSERSYIEKVGDSPITITITNDVPGYLDPASYALPPVITEAVTNGYIADDIEAQDLGDFYISNRSKTAMGTAKRLVGREGVADGYYLPLAMDDWEGASVTTKARTTIPFEDELVLVPLGVDGIDIESFTVTDSARESTTYQVAIECAEELPAVEVRQATGEHYGIDVSKLGTIDISNRSRTIGGKSELTAVPDFNGKGKPGVGHFVAFDLEPREGTEVRLRKGGEPGAWKASDSEPWVVLLDAGDVAVDGIDVKAQDGTVETYAVSVELVDEDVPVSIKPDDKSDTPYAGHTVADLGEWTVDMEARTLSGHSYLIEEWEGYSKKDRLPGYFAVIVCDPWEGVAARVHRDGEWGDWANCQNNGVVVLYLGKDVTDSDMFEIRAASGESTRYGIDIDAASPVMARAARAVGKAKKVADKASE